MLVGVEHLDRHAGVGGRLLDDGLRQLFYAWAFSAVIFRQHRRLEPPRENASPEGVEGVRQATRASVVVSRPASQCQDSSSSMRLAG